MNHTIQSVILAASFIASGYAADFLPLQAGNSWTYREATTGQSFTMSVGTPVITNNLVYYPLTGYANDRVFVRLDDQGRLLYLLPDTGAERILTLFTPVPGASWEAPLRPCNQEGATQPNRGLHDGPAGPINNVLEIRYRTFSCFDAGVESEQYAENIGMLRRVQTTFAGPRRWDLVSARIGHTRIEAMPNSSFSILIDDAPGDSIKVSLRLQTDSPAPLTLTFPSGQEYDLILRAADGRLLWQWSMGRLFTQNFHQRTVSGQWSVTIDVPRQFFGVSAPAPFTLEGRLTTAPGSPQFAVTHPLSLPAPARPAFTDFPEK